MMTEYKLRDLLTIKNGKDHKVLADGQYPVYGSGGIMRYVDSYLYDKPSILLPRKGSLTNIQFCEEPFWTVDTTYYTEINESLCDPYYLYRYITLLDLSSYDTGSAVPSMTFESYYQQKVRLPSLEKQKRVSKVLRTLDNKISLNEQINRNLEELARLIYDYWFVQFDFPDNNGKPYKSNGGKMVWDSTLKREIPENWDVKSINQISTSVRGVTYNSTDEKNQDDDNVVMILRGNNIANNKIVYDSNTVFVDSSLVSSEQIIKKFDIIMAMSSGSKEHVGKSAMAMYDLPHSYGAFCSKIVPSPSSRFFLEKFLHSDYFIKYIRQTSSGTGINNLNSRHFDNIFFAYPPDKIIDAFNSKVEPLYDRISSLQKESEQLNQLRDFLLPILMNGQVTLRG